MDFWQLVILVSFFCLGLTVISGEEKLLAPLRNWMEAYLPQFIAKPILTCCTCMSSFWGTVIYWYFHYDHFCCFDIGVILKWIAICVIAAFFNYTLKCLIDIAKKYLEKPD